MSLNKVTMVESRIRKRLKSLNLDSFSDYCDYLFSLEGMDKELEYFINAITTNKTDFFREPDHFDFLVNKALPSLLNTEGPISKKRINIWSAACSKGNEAYTIAIVLAELAANHPEFSFDFNILATDICTDVLNTAQTAVYQYDDVAPVSNYLKKKYFMGSKDRGQSLVRVVPEIRSKVKFKQLNLMDRDFKIREPLDIIFCRNVIIYFDKKTQDELIHKLCKCLNKDGYLFMGHSEALDCSELPLVSMAPAVYKKVNNSTRR